MLKRYGKASQRSIVSLSPRFSRATNSSGQILQGGSITKAIAGDGLSEAQSGVLAIPGRPSLDRPLYMHEMVELQLFNKNERPRPKLSRVESRPNQGLNRGIKAHPDADSGDKEASSTTEAEHTAMNPMLKRLSKKRQKKILKQQEDAPFDPRKQEEMILLEMAPHQQIEYISKSTHFSTAEVRDLQKMFRNLTQMYGTPGDMNRALFRVFFIQVLGITDSVMLDQIFNYFDAGGEGSISVTEFLSNLSIIIRGTLEEHIKFCYAVYDLNGDGGIGRPEVMALIHDTLSAPLDEDDDVDDSIRDMANMIMTQLDPEGTGQVTVQNFREAVLKDPLTLQILGPCLPEEKRVRSLMSLVIWDYQDFATNYSLPCCPGYSAERTRYDHKEDMYNSEAIKTASVRFHKPGSIKAKGR